MEHRQGAGDVRMGRDDHLVVRAHAGREQGEGEGGGARVDPDAMLGFAELGELRLEPLHLDAEDEAAVREDPLEGRPQLIGDRFVVAPSSTNGTPSPPWPRVQRAQE